MLHVLGFLLLYQVEGWAFSTTSLAAGGKTCGPLSMKIKVGLVGLPNVGKSTLFNAITQKSLAEAQNFPFCTIEPNISHVPVPDVNLSALAKLAGSKKALPATISLVDVAGLVKVRNKLRGHCFLPPMRYVI